MSPDPFDDLDRALASGLSALAPDVDGGDDALASMRPRFERARTRRRVAKAGVTIVFLLALGSVAALAAPNSTRSHVTVSSPPTTADRDRPPVRRTTTSAPTTTVPVTRGSTAPPVTPSTVGGSNGSSQSTPTTPATTPATVPGASGGGGPGPSGHGSTTTTIPATDGTHVYRSPGGSITVRFSRGSLVLLHVDPAHGYGSEVNDSGPDRIDVRFTQGGENRYRIELQVDNGDLFRTAGEGGH